MSPRQRDPVNEYKTEAFQLFEGLLNGLRSEVTEKLAHIRPLTEEEQQAMMKQMMAQGEPVEGEVAEVPIRQASVLDRLEGRGFPTIKHYLHYLETDPLGRNELEEIGLDEACRRIADFLQTL